jgi:hypothetical protein
MKAGRPVLTGARPVPGFFIRMQSVWFFMSLLCWVGFKESRNDTAATVRRRIHDRLNVEKRSAAEGELPPRPSPRSVTEGILIQILSWSDADLMHQIHSDF